MATLFVDKIDPQSGTSLEIGTSGDTISVPSGATINLSNATQTGVGGVNAPSFKAHRNSNFSADNETTTIIIFDDEEWDTNSAYDISNGRFTCPSGEAGKYVFYASARNATGNSTTRFVIAIRKNGTGIAQTNNNNGNEDSTLASAATTLAVGDYVDATIYQNTGATRTIFGDDPGKTVFFGYKLIGV
jgi:hypothetical protein